MPITISDTLAFAQNGVNLPSETYTDTILAAEDNYTKHTELVTTSDGAFDLDVVGTIGYVRLRNVEASVIITTPTAPVVVNNGTPGSTTVAYKVVALQADGSYSAASSAGTTTTSNAILTAAATNTVTATGTPADDDTIEVNGRTYTFKTTLTPTADEVLINGQPGSMTNLARAINNTGTPGTDYASDTVINADVSSSAVATNTITLTSKIAGAAGNVYTLSKVGTNISVGAALFSWNYNTPTWTPVAGAASYNVYRTTSPTTPSSTGLIANTFSNTLDDTGLVGDASTAPATGIDNVLLYGGDASGDYPQRLKGQEFAIFRSNKTAIHRKSSTSPSIRIEVTIIGN